MILCTVGSGINMLFSLRNPTVAITTYVIQLIAYPIGRGWDLVMPDKEWNVFGLKFNLRPGKFNYKEHVVIVAMSNVSLLPPCLKPPMPHADPSPRLLMVAVRCMPQMSLSPNVCSISRTSGGDSNYCLVLPLCALAMASLAWLGAFWSGLLP